MIVLDEYEKKVCRFAIQMCELERTICATGDNEEVKNAEDVLEEIRPELEGLCQEYPKSYESLKRKLADL